MKKRMPLDPEVAELLAAVAAVFHGLDYAIGGALAMAAHGVRRYTADVDVFALDETRPQVIRGLRARGLNVVPIAAPMHYAAYLPDNDDPEVRIDLMFPATEPELSAIEYPEEGQIGPYKVNVFPPTLLVIAKFYANRDKDEQDIAAMYNLGVFDEKEVLDILKAIDDEEAVNDFKALLKRATTPKTTRKPPRNKLPRKK